MHTHSHTSHKPETNSVPGSDKVCPPQCQVFLAGLSYSWRSKHPMDTHTHRHRHTHATTHRHTCTHTQVNDRAHETYLTEDMSAVAETLSTDTSRLQLEQSSWETKHVDGRHREWHPFSTYNHVSNSSCFPLAYSHALCLSPSSSVPPKFVLSQFYPTIFPNVHSTLFFCWPKIFSTLPWCSWSLVCWVLCLEQGPSLAQPPMNCLSAHNMTNHIHSTSFTHKRTSRHPIWKVLTFSKLEQSCSKINLLTLH